MSFQRTLLFTFAMSAAAFGCHKDRAGTPESSTNVVEGSGAGNTQRNTDVNTVAPAVAAPDPTPVTTDTATTDTATTGTTGHASGPKATATGTATTGTMSGGSVTTTTTNTAPTGTTGTTATAPAPTPAPAAQPAAAGTKDQQMQPADRQTLRQGTGWSRSDRADAPHKSPGQ